MLVAAMGDEGDRVASRFARGCRAFAVLDHGEVVSYGWLSTQPEWVGEVSAWMSPAAQEGYVWNCVTLPELRRRGHYRELLEGILDQARGEGLLRLWIGSVEDPAEKANIRVGFVPVLIITMRRFGGWRWVSIKPDPGADRRLVDDAYKRMGHRWWSNLSRMHRRIH